MLCWLTAVLLQNKPQGIDFSKDLFEVLIFFFWGGGFVFGGLLIEGKLAFQNSMC